MRPHPDLAVAALLVLFAVGFIAYVVATNP